jgi:hypothetical protein
VVQTGSPFWQARLPDVPPPSAAGANGEPHLAGDHVDKWEDLDRQCEGTAGAVALLGDENLEGIRTLVVRLWQQAEWAGGTDNPPPPRPKVDHQGDALREIGNLQEWFKGYLPEACAATADHVSARQAVGTGAPRNQCDAGQNGKAKRGRKATTNPEQDKEIADAWERARGNGVQKKDFAKGQKRSFRELNRILNRHAKRSKQARKK